MTDTNELLSYYSNAKAKKELQLRCKFQSCPNKPPWFNDAEHGRITYTSSHQDELHLPPLLLIPVSGRRLNLSHGERWICSAVQRICKAPNLEIIAIPISVSFLKKRHLQVAFLGTVKIFLFFFFFFYFTIVKSLTNNHFTLYSSSIEAITPGYVIN